MPPLSFSGLTLTVTTDAVAYARRHTARILQHWNFPDEDIEIARLIVSELIANAIRHARPEASTVNADVGYVGLGTVGLKLRPTDPGVLVAVSDQDHRSPTRRSGDSSAVGGRGLFLTDALASRWGYCLADSHSGKIVWAEIANYLKVTSTPLT
ncbi:MULTISPECIES: ATP-binding protein [unclassified Streptomyces]|uniref:ATP-binding protein n=1 Tax=unclassified Streptomyces TaxID=2593676 RepID=UPI0033A07FF2